MGIQCENRNIFKFKKSWTNRNNSIKCEDLKSVEIPSALGVWFGGLMVGVMLNHKKYNKSWPNWDNSILFKELWFVDTTPPMGSGMCDCGERWVDGVGSGQITKNWINLDITYIIQFCLKIYGLWRYLYSHTILWSQSLVTEIINIIHISNCLTFW